ncbi:glycosyltransferase family 4 protein [Agromyces aerolatus]|uniref:glycosyltransferase family 4 protein n=1 Tax=Agromyces sp. LY-1074 TaxID=3074080 RepID=UPI00285E2978|nr:MULTISPECIES: glycosyltransferase family 1 protein [unclassified Agromyces]MDR5700072.1 glycosyltransferase family 1 protein [Agromyces sp. LY-1074]MDR5706560.1 glycosyltransferase family 1 protein [Agromyces sp. LY-1358]
MRLVVDCRYTRIGQHDGISRFTAGIVRELAARHPLTMLISDRRQLELLPDLPWQLATSPTGVGEPFVARQVRKLRPDVVFSPMQTMGSWGRDYALVLTLHDLIYYENRTPPRDLPAPVRALWRLYHLAWWPQRLLLNRADSVVTVSETTAALIREHRLTKRPVTVVPNAADELPVPPLPRERPSRNRLVYMGSYMPYKNVDTLVRAAGLLPDHELHLLSRISPAERARLTRLAPEARLVFHDGVTDAAYADLLAGATALVHASRAEGFGIPLVEAMRVGTPVVVNDTPIFREIGGDAAVYFDGDDASSLAEALGRLEEPGEWQRRSAAALERASGYTWAASAERLLELLRETSEARRARRAR